jgi:hypothetical protein
LVDSGLMAGCAALRDSRAARNTDATVIALDKAAPITICQYFTWSPTNQTPAGARISMANLEALEIGVNRTAPNRWSLTSLQQRLFKTGGRLIRHARYFTRQLAESYLTRPLFRKIVARVQRLAWHPT